MILNTLEVLQLIVLFQLINAAHATDTKDSKRFVAGSVNDDDSDFLVHGGHIDGEDEDLLLLINSSFVIVDNENSTAIPIEEDDQKVNEESSNKTDSAPKQQSRLGKVKSRPPKLCKKYSEVEKYKLLGSRNQLFLANSIDEASKHFGDFYTEDDDENVSNNNVHTAWASFAFSSDTAASSCDARCQRIRGALLRAERQRSTKGRPRGQNRGIRPSSILDDPGLPAVQEGRMLPKRGCYLESFVATGNCTTNHWRNEFDQLCSKCYGVFRLGDGCFPQFLNAVECNGSDTPCIYDSLTHASHGKCRPQYLSFKVLQNMGDEECENWQQQTIEIPVACQCLLQKNSNLNLLSAEPFV